MTVFMLIFINMNEIPIYLKLISNKIIEQKGAKAVYINTGDYSKILIHFL